MFLSHIRVSDHSTLADPCASVLDGPLALLAHQRKRGEPMTMTKKQLKALRRHKRIVKKRNIRNNNLKHPISSLRIMQGRNPKRAYRLYDI